MEIKKNRKTVFVAMSGGVDSSVAAALLKRGRFLPAGRHVEVVGVFMKPWSPYGENPKSKIRNPKQIPNSKFKIQNEDYCLWKEDREDALRVAVKLDIPLLTWDLSEEYEKRVAGYMIEGYKNGITPNPDVMCNKFIKFGAFLEKAVENSADYIATGHYARIRRRGPVVRHPHSAQSADLRPMGVPHSRHPLALLKAKDLNKDQSYFLYTLTQKQLSRCLFPVGDYTKTEVRRMAKKFGLPNWDKKDSQGICFVGPVKVNEFLKKYIKPKKGQVVRKSDGQVLGEHDGVWYYTIGQRHGFNLNGGKPYYVASKDVRKNVLYVDGDLEFPISNTQFPMKSQILNSELEIRDFNWIGEKERLPLKCRVKTRYRQKDLDCTILKNGSDRALVEIKASGRPAHQKSGGLKAESRSDSRFFWCAGQSAVFYKGSEVLGGGIIAQ